MFQMKAFNLPMCFSFPMKFSHVFVNKHRWKDRHNRQTFLLVKDYVLRDPLLPVNHVV